MTRNILRPPRNYCGDISGRDSSVIGDPGSCRRWTTIIHRAARSARNEGMAEPRCVRGEGSNERAAFSWRPFSTSITSPSSPGPFRLRKPHFQASRKLDKTSAREFQILLAARRGTTRRDLFVVASSPRGSHFSPQQRRPTCQPP